MERTVNRVLQAWKSWDERQNEMEKAIGTGKEHAIVIQRLKLEHFQKCRNLIAGTARNDEQAFMPLMASTISKLEKQVYPNIIQRLFFRIKNTLIDRPAHIRHFQQQREENTESLKSQLVSSGFSDFAGKLESQLDTTHLKHIVPLSSQLDANRSLNVSLHFEKDAQDVFHFTTVEATLKHHDGRKADHSYQFKLDEWPGLNAQQVRNLLEGRAVKQHFVDVTGSPKSQWIELATGETAKKYTKSYGYDLGKIIDQFPAQALTQAGGKALALERLEQGHAVPIMWEHSGQREKVYLQADPASISVKLTDIKGKVHTPEQLNQQLDNRQEQKQAVIKKMEQAPRMKINQGKKRGVSQ